jgi:hypothetical protein
VTAAVAVPVTAPVAVAVLAVVVWAVAAVVAAGVEPPAVVTGSAASVADAIPADPSSADAVKARARRSTGPP